MTEPCDPPDEAVDVEIPRAPPPPTLPPEDRPTQPPSALPVAVQLVELSPHALAQVGEVVARVVDSQLGPLRRKVEDLEEAHYVERARRKVWEKGIEERLERAGL